MTERKLIAMLRELETVRRAPAVWRSGLRDHLLSQVSATPSRSFSFSEWSSLKLNEFRFALAPLRLSPLVTLALLIAVGFGPAARAVEGSLPGSSLYPVKRAAERVGLSLKSSAASQGLFYITLASRRLDEAKAVAASPTTQASLIRDYNIDLGFAQASLQATSPANGLASAYGRASSVLARRLDDLPFSEAAGTPYAAARELTNRLGSQALALVVGAHQSQPVASVAASGEVTEQFQDQIARNLRKLDQVGEKLAAFPAARTSPKVVLERREAIVPVKQAKDLATAALTEAAALVKQKKFSLALEKVQEAEEITQKAEAAVDKAEAADSKGKPKGGTGEVAPEPTPSVQGASTKGSTDAPANVPAETKPAQETKIDSAAPPKP